MTETTRPDPTDLARTLASRLRELRARHGHTQERVAKAIGVHESAVSRWEGGSRFPTGEDLIALADLFQVSVDYLLGRSVQFAAPVGAVQASEKGQEVRGRVARSAFAEHGPSGHLEGRIQTGHAVAAVVMEEAVEPATLADALAEVDAALELLVTAWKQVTAKVATTSTELAALEEIRRLLGR